MPSRWKCRTPFRSVNYASEISTIAWTSTVEFLGRPFTATAARAWRPLSPKMVTKKSEAPLMTCGLSLNPAMAFTNPVRLTMRSTRSSDPIAALITDSKLRAQTRAP